MEPGADLIPPQEKIFVGGGDFRVIGQNFTRLFQRIGGLQPHERVLDVGCGIGRMAVGLAEYLDERGSYFGFDIVPDGIEWCCERITPRFPNFHFTLADIRNSQYNPQGTITAEEYRFPYADESFDFVFLTSVFTHMLPPAVGHYLDEITRVMRHGARSFVTFLLLNDESRRLLDDGKADRLTFEHDCGVYRVDRPDIPEAVVAYDEDWVRSRYDGVGQRIQSIHYGNWCGRLEFTTRQDIVLASRP